MSARESSVMCTPECQGFLKKRKDKIRLRWVTYWFKLHNATLYFYNKNHRGTSALRGQYYLIEVESLHEITWTKKNHYSFEIAMRNGKRKVLAAESADLRQQWMYQLFQAMNCCVYNTTELNLKSETAPDYQSRIKSSSCSTLNNSQSEASDGLVSRRESCLWSLNMSPAESSQYDEVGEVLQKAEENKLENDYDVLPCCKPLQSEEAIYDTPSSNRRVSEREYETENIYDVPKYACRRKSMPESSSTNELPEITGLLHEMVACLGGNSADWVKATASGSINQPLCTFRKHYSFENIH